MASNGGDFYETFDSGKSKTIPEMADGDFAHQDSKSGLNNYTKNAVDDEQGSVPEVSSTKR